MHQRTPEEPPTGHLKFFHAAALTLWGLAGVWVVFWALKWTIAPSQVSGSMPEDLFFLEAGALLLAVVGLFFVFVQLMFDWLRNHG